MEEWKTALIVALEDPHPRVRGTAMLALFVSMKPESDERLLAALKKRLADPDGNIRNFAAIELANRGWFAGVDFFRRQLDHRNAGECIPVSVEAQFCGYGGHERAAAALANVGTPEVFALVLEFPLHDDDYSVRAGAFKGFGQALCRHPESVVPLLRAEDKGDGYSQVKFAQRIFREAARLDGTKALLALLHEALKSDDRVVRANAARACGALGNTNSIPLLRAALKPESGLSRAAAVWALGELRVREALPELLALYQETRADSQRGRGPGWRAGQMTAEERAQYERLRSLNQLGQDWNELKAAATPAPQGPRATEQRLVARDVLEAIRKLGPDATQDFHRSLVSSPSAEDRLEAAVALAHPSAAAKNLPLLRSLLGDAVVEVRAAALVSVQALGDEAAQGSVRAQLQSADNESRRCLLQQLARLDKAQLEFCRAEVKALAEGADTPLYLKYLAATVLGRLR